MQTLCAPQISSSDDEWMGWAEACGGKPSAPTFAHRLGSAGLLFAALCYSTLVQWPTPPTIFQVGSNAFYSKRHIASYVFYAVPPLMQPCLLPFYYSCDLGGEFQ